MQLDAADKPAPHSVPAGAFHRHPLTHTSFETLAAFGRFFALDATMEINDSTLNLVKEFEGLELAAYRDPVGVLTIGYGYTNRAGFGPGVKSGDVWTEETADEMLAEGLERFGARIKPLFKRTPTDNQFGAMVSLAYNIGTGAFSKSTCLRRFNAGDLEGAAEALQWFNKAGGRVLRGLTRRRTAEAELFLSGSIAEVPTGTPRPDREKTATSSTTIQATLVAFLATLGQVMDGAKNTLDQITESFGVSAEIALAIIASAALAWVFRERLMKLARGV